jgi:hypothetical protein
MNPLDAIMKFVMDNIFVLAIIVVGGYFAYMYLKLKTKLTGKPINRGEIERMRFIERMKYNRSPIYKWLYKGNQLLGKITMYREYVRNPSNLRMIDMVINPMLFWKISNPFARLQAIQLYMGKMDVKTNDKETQIGVAKNDKFEEIPIIHVEDKSIEESSIKRVNDKIILPNWLGFDMYFGIYYDMTIPTEHLENIKNDNLIRTDLNELASIYYCKSQEESTFDPIRAHEMAMREKEIQLEVAKRKGRIESI